VTHAERERLMSVYDRLARTTASMLDAALNGRWDELVALEEQCASLIANMSQLENDKPLPETLRTHKASMLRKVLADDAAIRNITEPWLQQLGAMLGANRHQQRLLHTYGPPLQAD
jgi:flagellar protein FliT